MSVVGQRLRLTAPRCPDCHTRMEAAVTQNLDDVRGPLTPWWWCGECATDRPLSQSHELPPIAEARHDAVLRRQKE